MSNTIDLVFTNQYGQYNKGDKAFFPIPIAQKLMASGVAKELCPVIPADRQTVTQKMVKKGKK